MTKQDALTNTINALSNYRALHGAPTEIEIAFDGDTLKLSSGWSKSSVQKTRFEKQIVFLVMDSGSQWPQLQTAFLISYGENFYPIGTAAIKGPEESGYWLLPVKG